MSNLIPLRYIYQKYIDRGSFGSVSLYKDSYLDRLVAIKTILKQEDNSSLSEVRLIKKIDSKHVVGIYDVIEDENELVIIQEYLSGSNLNEKLGLCDRHELLMFAYQMIAGIEDIHKSGVCHRDIKLENMKFDAENVLKIFDFGISRIGDNHSTMNGGATIAYAAPELWIQDEDGKIKLSFAVDIYAFGVAIWALATGKIDTFNPIFPNCIQPSFQSINLNINKQLSNALNATLHQDHKLRPSASFLKKLLHKELLKGKHQANFVHSQAVHTLNNKVTSTTIKVPTDTARLTVSYNGYDFTADNIIGEVLFNNQKITPQQVLPAACVITFSESNTFISFSSSHPETVI